jgi:transcriptional regulator with XRE-family HTH domain
LHGGPAERLRYGSSLGFWRGGDRAVGLRTIDMLFDQTGLSVEDVAERSGLTPQRVEAIAHGRWTPSPDERRRMAEAFGVAVEAISWGHTMNPRNVRYRRFGFKENF